MGPVAAGVGFAGAGGITGAGVETAGGGTLGTLEDLVGATVGSEVAVDFAAA